MSFAIETDPVPLKIDEFGVVRVAETRVPLDTIVAAYMHGSTVEEIAEQFPTVSLPDIHAVIAFYLRHQEQVHAYLQERNHQREAIRLENERRFPPDGVRQRLVARRAGKQ